MGYRGTLTPAPKVKSRCLAFEEGGQQAFLGVLGVFLVSPFTRNLASGFLSLVFLIFPVLSRLQPSSYIPATWSEVFRPWEGLVLWEEGRDRGSSILFFFLLVPSSTANNPLPSLALTPNHSPFMWCGGVICVRIFLPSFAAE